MSFEWKKPGRLMEELVVGLLVWALIADTPYHLYPAYGWVMFVAVFLWLVTIVFFILYLFQLHMKLYMVPWPLVSDPENSCSWGLRLSAGREAREAHDCKTSKPGTRRHCLGFKDFFKPRKSRGNLMIFNVSATVFYITAFIACAAVVELTSLKGSRPYNQRAAASFFSCLVMIAYGLSAFFSFQAWRGVGSNAATSQMAGGYA
ncbi:PREDICTED: plasmolipin isoform X2 [Condylura cristata]|uniref:plasmolipin isoform X2 n=1 Tax=Condylura cristata TaxID=143302 RepID=UPI0006436A09|nr:PREDICTED: plasmolipin isoform X2 [Condylura cristata]